MKMAVFWVVAPCTLDEFTNVSEVCTASIIRVTNETASGKSVEKYFYKFWYCEAYKELYQLNIISSISVQYNTHSGIFSNTV
jgi:hypothetical protein